MHLKFKQTFLISKTTLCLELAQWRWPLHWLDLGLEKKKGEVVHGKINKSTT
jgi:hypothetical protein